MSDVPLPEPHLDIRELTACERCTMERMCDVHMWLRIRTWTFDPMSPDLPLVNRRKAGVQLPFDR